MTRRTNGSAFAASPRTNMKKRDDEFYISLITFEVEGILFRVPRCPFGIESEVFRGMFTLPSADDTGTAEGNSDEKPLILHGIAAKDFRALLKALMTPAYGSRAELTVDEWISVLRLAQLWSFDTLFEASINALESLNIGPAKKIRLAKKYQITKWLRPSYFELVMRLEALTLDEADVLGTECVLKLAQLRELRYKRIVQGTDSEPSLTHFDRPVTYGAFGRFSGQAVSAFGNPQVETRPVSALEIGLDPDVYRESVDKDYAERLKRAMQDAITSTFDLDPSP